MPTQMQAGVYSAVTHYLKAVDALGSDEAKAVGAKMRDMPIHDLFAHRGFLRARPEARITSEEDSTRRVVD
jgi:branched-chain amino acid transport system substrate-binding protein